jgi:NAD(P)H-hydrate epimerase
MKKLNKKLIKSFLPERKPTSHKGDFGKVFIVAGSKGMLGAAILASRGALKSGAGIIKLGIPDIYQPMVNIATPEVITVGLASNKGILSLDSKDEIINEKADVLAIGPGIRVNPDIEKLLPSLIRESSFKHMIIDADGLNAILKNPTILKNAETKIVVTPHPGEMARLTKLGISDVQNQREFVARKFSKQNNVIVVLKGAETVIAEPGGETYLSPVASSGFASGGVGDVLTGIIAGFAAQMDLLEAVLSGVFVHSLAGLEAVKEKGVYGTCAQDIVEMIPVAIKRIYGK